MYKDDVFLTGSSASASWLYYNPDSTAGGQFVEIVLPHTEILEAAEQHPDAAAFFRYWLDNPAPQYLTDRGSADFDTTASEYEAAQLRGCTAETMAALVEIARQHQ